MKFSLACAAIALNGAAIANPQGWNVVGADAQVTPIISTTQALTTSSRPSTTATRALTTSTSGGRNPCAVLSTAVSVYSAQNPDATKVPFIPSHVLACQRDVPINKTLAASQVDWLRSFTQFQSSLEYLKNPPAGYDLPPVDILNSLEAIKQKALSNGYGGQFDYELDLYKLYATSGDGHFSYSPRLISSFILRRVPLVSVSVDGIQLPKVYFLGKSILFVIFDIGIQLTSSS